MKRIYFGDGATGHEPFWKPWGCLGCLGRFILFLVLLSLLILLLSLFRKCSNPTEGNTLPDEFRSGSDAYEQPIGQDQGRGDDTGDDTGDGVADPDWNHPVPGGEDVGLPSPGDNVLPPFDQEEPIPNPDNGGSTQIYPNLLYVIFDSDANDESFKLFAQKFSSLYPAPEHKIEYYNTSSKTAVLSVPEETRMQICQNLPQQISEVEFLVVPVEVMTQGASGKPNDPAFRYPKLSWHFSTIQAYEAWAITKGSPDVIVGIVDSYMDLNHEELKGDRILYPYSVINGTSNVYPRNGAPKDYWGHGTLVTSVAVGNMDNSKGSCGIAPKCKFIPVSLGECLNTVTMVEGLLYCIYRGADVINLSCGTAFTAQAKSLPLDEQIKFSEQQGVRQEKMWDYVFKIAKERNVTIVWAAGNENLFTAMDTSKRNGYTIRVSAVDSALHKADFSNFGNFRDKGLYESTISAPGVEIFGALPGNSYECWSGTSFSAPIITGVVALMKSLNANLTAAEIINILQKTGKPVDGSPEIGKLVQVRDALLEVKKQIPNFSSDISSLKGLWETTTAVPIYDQNDKLTGDKGKVQFKINDANSAEVYFFKSSNKKYVAPASVSINRNEVTIKQTSMATLDGATDCFSLHVIKIKPDQNGKMKCYITGVDSNITDEAYIRKIN